jgi:hypothetical protein
MTATNETAPPLNHVFVDFENVHHIDVSVIGATSVIFTLLLGAKQTKLDAGLVEKLIEHAASVQGRAVSTDPAAHIHIVSKDKGFDPLVKHLRSRHIHAHRHDNFATLDFAVTARVATMASQAEPARKDVPLNRVLEHLRKNVANRPKKKKTLLSHLKSQLGKEATEAKAARLIETLRQEGHISIGDKDVVTYHV